MERLQSVLGIIAFIGLAYLLSNNKKSVDFKLVIKALGLQLILAILLIGIPSLSLPAPLFFLFEGANAFINSVIGFTYAGTKFLFGPLADRKLSGDIIAIQVLPTIIFFSSLSSVLYYYKILPFIIDNLAKGLKKVFEVSGAETLSVVANVFVGQTEAPLVIKPFLDKMTNSELFTVMVGGMATVAGGVMVAYVGFLSDSIPNIAGHLVVASVLSAPATLMFAKILIPETEIPETMGALPKQKLTDYENVIDAAASGASDGLKLAANVGAMLIAFIALIYMGDALLIYLGNLISFNTWGVHLTPEALIVNGETQLTLNLILSWLFFPFSFFLGIPFDEMFYAAGLLGKKVAFNEFIAYLDLAQAGDALSAKSKLILSYALCGFANFSSIAIQVGGIGSIAPARRKDLARLGIKSVIGGTLAAFVTACFAGILY